MTFSKYIANYFIKNSIPNLILTIKFWKLYVLHLDTRKKIQHIYQFFINIEEIGQNMPVSCILTTEYLLIWVLSLYFKSAKVIKLKTLYLSNVKKFYNDLTWPIKFIKHIYIYSQILSYLSIKIDIYNFRIFIQRHFGRGG